MVNMKLKRQCMNVALYVVQFGVVEQQMASLGAYKRDGPLLLSPIRFIVSTFIFQQKNAHCEKKKTWLGCRTTVGAV